MINVWGKIFADEKIVKHFTVSVQPSECTFFDMIKSLCEGLDIPTPVLLNKHITDFNKFSMTLFKPADFIESVNFDKFIVEYLPQD
mgnify:FL=1